MTSDLSLTLTNIFSRCDSNSNGFSVAVLWPVYWILHWYYPTAFLYVVVSIIWNLRNRKYCDLCHVPLSKSLRSLDILWWSCSMNGFYDYLVTTPPPIPGSMLVSVSPFSLCGCVLAWRGVPSNENQCCSCVYNQCHVLLTLTIYVSMVSML